MRLMRRFAVPVMPGPSAVRPAGRDCTAPVRPEPARCVWVRSALRLTVPGLVILLAAGPAALAASPAPARAAGSPGNTLASVIPSTAIPGGRVTFAVACGRNASAATLYGQPLGLPRQIQMRAGSATGEFTVAVILPGNIRPAIYNPGIECSDGTATTARLLIPAFGPAATAQPGGGALSAPASTWLAVGGLVLMSVGAVTGALALRRRSASHSHHPDQPDRTALSDDSGPSNRFDYSNYSNFRF